MPFSVKSELVTTIRPVILLVRVHLSIDSFILAHDLLSFLIDLSFENQLAYSEA